MVSVLPSHRYAVEEANVALVRAIGSPRRVLDVGCGAGLNGAVARGRGAEVVGVETSVSAARLARERLAEVLSLDIEQDEAIAAQLGGRSFDLLLLGDVLEHLRDPEAALRRLIPLLEEEGRIVVSVPNVAAWTVRAALLLGDFDYQPSGILDETHLRFFTERSITALLTRVGLEILQTDLNPMLVRAAKAPISRAHRLLAGGADGAPPDPLALSRSWPYAAYQALVRPAEDAVARAAPGLFAFQHVIVARKPPRPRPLTLTVGMLTMDEEQAVAPMIAAIREVAPDAELLCVDSSTRDRTAQVAAEMGARVLRQVPARGHGPAMELLMREASARTEALIYLDCDGTYPVAEIPRFRRLLEVEAVDVVNGARTRSKPAAMPWPNYLANRSFAGLAHALHGVPTADVHSGLRAYRSSVIRAFDFDGEGDALPIDTLLLPVRCGYRVVEVPIAYDERVGPSKLRKLAGASWTMIRLGRALGVGARDGHGPGGSRFEVR